MLRRIRAVSGTHNIARILRTSGEKLPGIQTLKVSLYNEQKTYWTFALDDKLKVGTILDQISDKLSTKNLTLFVRTKSRLGRRSDKKLEPSVSLYDLNEKYRKKKKAYHIYVHSPVVNVNLARVNSDRFDRFSMPITRGTKLWDDLDADYRSSSEDLHSSANVSSTSTPRLSTSHSAPLYLSVVDEKTRTDGPVIVEQPPKEVAQILFSHNGSLQRTISGQCVLNGKGTFGYEIEKTGSSFFKQGSIYGWSAMTPTDNSIFGRFDLPRPEEREPARRNVSRRRITDVSASTPPTPANSFKPRDVAPIDHSSFFKNKSTDNYPNPDNNTFKQQKQNDTLIIIRVYANNNGELDGPCWTIAVGPNTIAKEICSIIEVHVGVVPNSLRLCLINALSNSGTDEGERKVEDEERLLEVRAEWLNKGCIPFFFVREKNSCLLVHNLPRRPQSAQEIRGHRRVESEDGKENTAIFLGGSNVEITEPESPEFTPHRRETIDSSSWIMERHSTFNQDLCPLPSVNWIPSSELERVHKVGDGGYAKVYKSKYKDKFVAVKTLKGVATKDHIESFKKEFEVLSLTNSPYLIKFYGASIDETDPTSPLLSIVVEYCERGTLYKALCNKKLEIDWQTCFKWLHQTLNGMLYLHNMTPQMVHRDIKTLNLLLDSKWNIKVADFGLSRSMSMTNKSSLGELKGTLAYCAPEIHRGMLFTPKSDAYSVAIVMWELITRCLMGQYHAPYSEYSDIYHDFQIIFLTDKQNRRPTIPPKTPPALRDLLQQCWAGNPDERPTCDEILLQVQSIYVQYQTEKNHWESLRQVV